MTNRASVFPGGSEMSALMCAYDWAQSDAGAPETWPPNLRFALSLCLTCEDPMAIWWGPSLMTFYNDAYISILGRLKHPAALGRSCWSVWPESGTAYRETVETVRATGIAACFEGSSFKPIQGAGDAIDGVLCIRSDPPARRPASVERKIQGYQERLREMAFDAVVAEERERRRIAADLHDGIGQSLSLAQIKLTSVRSEISGGSREIVEDVIELLDESIASTRTLTFDLSPPLLYDLGIHEALSWLSEKLEKRHGARIDLTDDGKAKPLDDVTAGIVFRATRELLTNVLKHARTPRVNVSLRRAGRHFELVVEDAGCGFDPEESSLRHSGFGLFSVREQITRLGGIMEIKSAPDRGARIRMRVPIRANASVATPLEVKS